MICCGRIRCCPPVIQPLEYEIDNNLILGQDGNIHIPIVPETDIDLLKDKIICEYLQIISDLERGQYSDLRFLLEEISLVELEQEINNREFYVQYYLNNDQRTFSKWLDYQ